MKTVLTYITLLMIASFVLSSCGPEVPQYLGEYRLGEEGESYIKFEPGSYWVYQNDQTGERDSIVMQWYSSEMLHFEGRIRDYYREHIQFQWKGSSGTYTFYNSHPFVDLTPESQFQTSISNWGFITSLHGIGTSSLVFMPVKQDGGGGAVGGLRMELFKTYDSLQVQGQWYYDVAEFEAKPDPLMKGRITKYYWAKHVGLIKREKYAHWTREYIEGWELIDYDVTQA